MNRLLVAILWVLLTTEAGFATCNKDTNVVSNCLDELTDAAKSVVRSNDDAEKSKTVGQAVGNCAKCASEALGDQVKQFSPSSNDNTDGN